MAGASSSESPGGFPEEAIREDEDAREDSDPIEEMNIDEIGDIEMKAETETKLRNLYSHWSSKFAALHEEAEQAIAEYDAAEREIEADIERRQNPVRIQP